MPKKSKKVIELFTDQHFEESALEMLARYEPGPVYLLSTDTPDGPGMFVCDEPFTIEEAEAQHDFMNEQSDDTDGPDFIEDPVGASGDDEIE